MATDRTQPEWIEIIDADVAVFGASGCDDERDPRPVRMRSGSRVATGAVVLGLVAGATFVSLQLRPWHQGPQVLRFPAGTHAMAGDGHWVLDGPPGRLLSAGTGVVPEGEPGGFPFDDSVGYAFAEADASAGIGGEPTGRWALFRVSAFDGQLAAGTNHTVQGAPALVRTVSTGGVEISFGPVDGQFIDVTSHGLSPDEALRFAGAVGLSDGVPTVSDSGALAGMRPVGSVQDVSELIGLLITPGASSIPRDGTVFVRYGTATGVASLGSTPFVGDHLGRLLHLFFPGLHERTLSGRAAFVTDEPPPDLGIGIESLVMWFQDGRLVMVTSSDDLEATVALAESVRSATAEEWTDVEAAAERTTNPLSQVAGG